MKGFDMVKIKQDIKAKEKEQNKIMRLFNHLLPATPRELQEAITINNMLDNNY